MDFGYMFLFLGSFVMGRQKYFMGGRDVVQRKFLAYFHGRKSCNGLHV